MGYMAASVDDGDEKKGRKTSSLWRVKTEGRDSGEW